jgi:anti-sigma factor RsiW
MTDPHLSDEELSDVIDGAERPEAAAHLAACATCSARLAAIRAVVDAVALEPPTPSPGQRAAAVGVAMGRPATGRRPAAWLGVAAAVVALLLGGAALLTQDSGDRQTADTAQAPFAAGESSGGANATGTNDLGDIDDPAALHEALATRLGPAAKTTARAGAAAQDTAELATSGPPCLAEVGAAGAGELGEPAFTALLRYQRTPAIVLVYVASGGKLSRRAFVMATEGCRLLVVQSF